MAVNNPGKRIVLGVTGGIAAIKAHELVRDLRNSGAEIAPVLTANARRFVAPTALQAMSGNRPRDNLWDAEAEASMGHIELARWADAIVIAPATANVMAKLAGGLADDLLTTLCLATTAPLFLAPAMNNRMWHHHATQRNVSQLLADGVTMLGPAEGEQACGEFGLGRMLEPADIAQQVMSRIGAPRTLDGVNVLVTAGPTREFLDPVRFISNRSSGKQGFALAEAARDAGADVTLVAGPVHLATPAGVERIDVVSASEMKAAVAARVERAGIFISVAAVADYRPSHMSARKLKKTEASHLAAPGTISSNGDAETDPQRVDGQPCAEASCVQREGTRGASAAAADTSPRSRLNVILEENDDIVGSIAGAKVRPFVVGFAAETHDALAYARDKRLRKGMDAIVVNDVSDATIGFDQDHNAVTLIHEGGELPLERMPKRTVASRLVAEIAALYRARPTASKFSHAGIS